MKAEVGKRYRHYKGKEYTVLALGRHEADCEEVVVYQAEYDTPDFGSRPIWVRAKASFEEKIEVAGEWVERFVLIG